MTWNRSVHLGLVSVLCIYFLAGCHTTAPKQDKAGGHDGDKYVGNRVTLHCYAGGTYTGTVTEWSDTAVRMTSDDGIPVETTPANVATVIRPKPRTAPPKANPSKRKAVTLRFKVKHSLAECVNATTNKSNLDKLLVDYPDSVLLHEEDSVVGVRVPARGEHYHAHILSRNSEGELVDRLVHEGKRSNKKSGENEGTGQIIVDLKKFPKPEHMVVVTWPVMEEKAEGGATSKGAGDVQRALIPPFIMSLKLVEQSHAEAWVKAQSFRHELQTPVGTLDVMTQPFNHGSMLLNIMDRGKQLPQFLWNVFPSYRPADATLAPQLLAEVYTKQGQPWQRIGIWPVPSEYPKQDPDAKVFALRTKRFELLDFAAPAQVKLVVPQEKPGVQADVVAKFTGMTEDQPARLIFTHSYADVGEGQFSQFAQDHEVKGDATGGKYAVSLKDVPGSRFPLTVSVSNRFIQPWKKPGGFLNVRPATVHRLSEARFVKPPTKIIASKAASHYWLLTMHGPTPGTGDGGAMSPFALPRSKFSPNMTPGPGPNGGNGDLVTTISTKVLTNIIGDNSSEDDLPAGMIPLGPSGGGGGGGGGKSKGEKIIEQKCQGKEGGCEQDPCRCGSHLWNMFNFRANFPKMFPGAADFAWEGSHGDSVPCHTKTAKPQGRLRVKFNLPSARFKYEWWDIYVIFKPCNFQPKGGGGKKKPPPKGFEEEEEEEPKVPKNPKPGDPEWQDWLDDNRVPSIDPKPIPAPTRAIANTLPLESEIGNSTDVGDVIEDKGSTSTGGGGDDGHGDDSGEGGGHGGKKKCCCCCCCKNGRGVTPPGGDGNVAYDVLDLR